MIAPHVSHQCLVEALQLELKYLKEDLAANAGDRSDKTLVHNAYAVLTACRILYSASQKTLALKTTPTAGRWKLFHSCGGRLFVALRRIG
jgi:hypothetical protein